MVVKLRSCRLCKLFNSRTSIRADHSPKRMATTALRLQRHSKQSSMLTKATRRLRIRLRLPDASVKHPVVAVRYLPLLCRQAALLPFLKVRYPGSLEASSSLPALSRRTPTPKSTVEIRSSDVLNSGRRIVSLEKSSSITTVTVDCTRGSYDRRS